MRRRIFAVPGAVAVVCGAVAVVWASLAPVGASARPSAAGITAVVPGEVTVGRTLTISGRVSHAPAASTAELEGAGAGAGAGGRWSVLAKGSVGSGRFAIRWTPRTAGFFRIRLVVARDRALVARTTPTTIVIGAAPVYCAAPAKAGPPPAGDGYIVGGVYNVGGPAPGLTVCRGQVNTVSVANAGGATVATAIVAARRSYRFVVPAGSYTLTAGFCRGSASVRAGAETRADTVCPVP